jgi:primosomal protein N'
MVVAATAAEATRIHEVVVREVGDVALLVAADEDAGVTRSWELAQTAGRVLIGTPRIAAWLMADLGLVIVLEEGRRAMKERQTPTIHVREITAIRSRVEGFNAVFFGPTPSLELLAAGGTVRKTGRRPWGLVEVVDRSAEGPGSGLLSDQVMAALKAILSSSGGSAFIQTGRPMVGRMIQEANVRLGSGAASEIGGAAPVVIGTERDLADLDPVTLTVAADTEVMLAGASYRGAEEALRQLARLGNKLSPGRGRRLMLQTRDPGSPLIVTMRRGDPIPYLQTALVDRARQGYPPSTEMMAIELRGHEVEGVDAEISGLGDIDVFGPRVIETGRRWLLRGDLTPVRPKLRPIVGRWREKGATVRIDADPLDL